MTKISKERFKKSMISIKKMMRLNHWDINISRVDKFEDDIDNNTYGRLSYIDEPHKQATVQFNYDKICCIEDYELFIIHELLHIYLHTHSIYEEQSDFLINRLGRDMYGSIENSFISSQERSIANLQYVIYNLYKKDDKNNQKRN